MCSVGGAVFVQLVVEMCSFAWFVMTTLQFCILWRRDLQFRSLRHLSRQLAVSRFADLHVVVSGFAASRLAIRTICGRCHCAEFVVQFVQFAVRDLQFRTVCDVEVAVLHFAVSRFAVL